MPYTPIPIVIPYNSNSTSNTSESMARQKDCEIKSYEYCNNFKDIKDVRLCTMKIEKECYDYYVTQNNHDVVVMSYYIIVALLVFSVISYLIGTRN